MTPDSGLQTQGSSPADLGYHMPAEWEPHQATWISWPHNPETWPEVEKAERAMALAVKALSAGELVRINVLDADHEVHVRALLDQHDVEGDVAFHYIPTNDAWCRDHGAIFVVKDTNGRRQLAATDWRFNAWGGKYPPWDQDEAVARQMAEILGVPRFEGGIILEGGAIEVNGAGTMLTTEACLLNENRNPHLSKEEIEGYLRRFFKVQKILWLGDGIVGDDTDGHVDDITRFVSEDTVVTVNESDPEDANYHPLQENLRLLETMTLADGRPLRVLELPMPAPVVTAGVRLPASYANFYIGNKVVLLPTFDDPMDEVARATLQGLFRTREVIGINCRDLVWGLGAFHCLTQQVPATGA